MSGPARASRADPRGDTAVAEAAIAKTQAWTARPLAA